MPTELLMQGADAYTSLTEVTTTPETDTPEATPIVSIFFSIGVTIATFEHSC
ncbi:MULTISPECIES: hypothetical protein [unclassified Streptosporangium]|uniref:hypothetical protein n=1 Tax=Streptosporangium sp. NPDC005286 TaxID=3154463 RepID=UPI0033B875C4